MYCQGSYATFPTRSPSWTKGIKLKQYVTNVVGKADICFPLKRNLRLRCGFVPCMFVSERL